MMKTPLLVVAGLPCLLLGSAGAVDSESGVHHVPLFTSHELAIETSSRFVHTLTTTGLLALPLPLQEATARATAMSGLCQCRSQLPHLEGADSIALGDGQTVRSTLATATVGTAPLPLHLEDVSKACGTETAQAMEVLRDQVADASRIFLQALDKLLLLATDKQEPILRNSYGGSYQTVSEIVQAASHLEHFHVYSKSSDADAAWDNTNNNLALQVHTDAGLFLAFVPAWSCLQDTSADQSFHIQHGNKLLRAVFPPNSVAIVLGAGAEHWLRTAPLQLRATRHAVQMPAGASRTWYGMMHLVPESAIVEDISQPKTFGQMRQAMILKSHSKTTRQFGDDPANAMANDIAIGCGFADSNSNEEVQDVSLVSTSPRRRRLQHVENAGACNNVTNFYCWMSCLDIPNQEQAEGFINEGYSLYCVDPSIVASTGKVSQAQQPCIENGVVGLAMNSNCMGMWQPTAPGVPAQTVIVESSLGEEGFQEPWCYGGTSMYMDGFQWLGSTCVIYLFPKFVVESAGALIGACFFTIFFGMALEWVIQQRRATVQRLDPGMKRLAVSAGFYGVQLSMGYTIMLVVMIYSIPLFISVVVGIVSGHVLFSSPDALFNNNKNMDCSGGGGATASKGTASDKFSDGPQDASDSRYESCRDLSERAPHPMGASSTAEHIPGFASTACSRRKRGELPAQVQDLAVPEGSTPCCQNVL